MKAKDTNAALSPDDQAEKTFDGNALSSVMTYTTDNHHHFNDVIEVKLPHATYLWGVLTDFLGQDSDLTCTLKKKCFAYRYGEGAWVKGKVPPAPVD